MQVYDLKLVPLDANEFIAMDTVEDILPGCFHPPVHHAQDLFVADIFRLRHDKVFHDGGCGFPERV